MPATEDYLRDPKLMHRWFCGSAVALLAVTVWMMWADHNDEWRVYERTAMDLQAKRDHQRLERLVNDPARQQALKDAEDKLKEATAALDHGSEANLGKAISEQAIELAKTMRELRVKRALRDVLRADYNLAVSRNDVDQMAVKQKDFDAAQQIVDQFEARYKEIDESLGRKKAQLASVVKQRTDVEKRKKELEADTQRLQAAINKIEPASGFSRVKRQIMQWPIIDGFNSPIRIHQDWLPNLHIDLGGMTKVARFDRCRTCHYNIDMVDVGTSPAFPHHAHEGEAHFEHPYASHPRLDLFLTASSPHPLPKFGCTICHEGQGSGTSFQNASHTPNHPEQEHLWEHDHKWFDNHFWEHPMHPKRFQETSCIRCHVNVTDLGSNPKFGSTAPKVVKGYELVRTYGCFGCHEINGYDGKKRIAVDMRLEPATAEEAARIAADPLQVAGSMRKVGPSLEHLDGKVEADWVAYWTDEPKRFRPTTKMPQFFHLTNQHDETAEHYNPVEIAAITHYLKDKSTPIELLEPAAGYTPNAERGKQLFATKGCAGCHSHEVFPEIHKDFGPDLSKTHAKIRPGVAGFKWLYTWIREPERHHPRTKMPNLYLEAEGSGATAVDPAADIAAFLLKLQGSPAEYKPTEQHPQAPINPDMLAQLTRELLVKVLTKPQIEEFLKTGVYPIPANRIKGDEKELVAADESKAGDDTDKSRRLMNYVGRRAISKYGCYGCHQIGGFEEARPIGTGLADWGKKDRSRLAFEHIGEYLHHHGRADLGVRVEALDAQRAQRLQLTGVNGVRVSEVLGSAARGERVEAAARAKDGLKPDDVIVSVDGTATPTVAAYQSALGRTVVGAQVLVEVRRGAEAVTLSLAPDGSIAERVEDAVQKAKRHEFKSTEEEERELSAAFYVESLHHHGRPGFLWQKLREPRSYDFKMTETKPYDDRLRMPRFPFTEEEIDAIATFVLGLIAEPPAPEYLVNPSGPAGDRIRGEQLLKQFNCTTCHMLEPPKVDYAAEIDGLAASDTSSNHPAAIELLRKVKPPRNALTGRQKTVTIDGKPQTLPVISVQGMVRYPDPTEAIEDQEYTVESWHTVKVGDKELFPTEKFSFNAQQLDHLTPAVGGDYGQWLVNFLVDNKVAKDANDAWQKSPPLLYQEGVKVQTPWLFNFLRNPGKIRHTTVLRMPRFNMSDDEARVLSNYFAAVDGVEYPYQTIPQREPKYLTTQESEFKHSFPNASGDYLHESWALLNAPVCIKCHAVGGRMPAGSNPATDIRGPNLDFSGDRLRSDWLTLWLYRPSWITPYTSMPAPFTPTTTGFEQYFNGEGSRQTVAIRDALLNYHPLLEREGKVTAAVPAPNPTPAKADGDD